MIDRKRVLQLVAGMGLGIALGAVCFVSYGLLSGLFNGGNSNGSSHGSYSLVSEFAELNDQNAWLNELIAPSVGAKLRNLSDLGQFKTQFAKRLMLHKLVAVANKKTLLNLLTQSSQIASTIERHEVQAVIAQRLAMLDPMAALAHTTEIPLSRQPELTRAVFQEWSMYGLDQAISHAKGLHEVHRQSALEGIFDSRDDLPEQALRNLVGELNMQQAAIDLFAASMARDSIEHPDEAWTAFVNVRREVVEPIHGSQLLQFQNIASALLEKYGIEEAFDLVDVSLAQEPARRYMLGAFLDHVAKDDPHLAFDLAVRAQQDQDDRILDTRVFKWAGTDSQDALQASLTFTDPDMRKNLLHSFGMSGLALEDPRQWLDSLASYSGEAVDFLRFKGVYWLARKSPEHAAGHLAQIDDFRDRLEAARDIATLWVRRDPISALQWAAASESLQHMRPQVMSIVLPELVHTDPHLALQTALEQEQGETEPGLEANVLNELAKVDVDLAIDMLPRARNAQTKQVAALGIGRVLIRNGNAEAALELSKQFDESGSLDFLESLFADWAQFDPYGLYLKLEHLKDSERSMAANSLLAQKPLANTRYLTEPQLDEIESRLESLMSN